MRKLLLLIISFLFFAYPKAVRAQEYIINNFQSDITINRDASITVRETIDTEFLVPKHGIFRIIPYVYSSKGKTIKAKIRNISITDEMGVKYQYEKSRLGQSVKLKIGDPDKTMKGEMTYVIKYSVDKILLRFKEHDEIYWNVTGSEWDTDVLASSTTVSSPYATIGKIACFTGEMDNCISEIDDNKAKFSSKIPVGKGKDFTIVVGLNKENSIQFPGLIENIVQLIFDNWGYLFSFLPLILIFRIWYRRGRDRRYLSDNVYYKPDKVGTGTVSLFSRPHLPLVYYPLDGLSPSEVGTIVDERVNIHDVIAEIVEMARLGFIKIEQIKAKKLVGEKIEYAFIKTDKYDNKKELSKLKDYQKYILKEIFRSKIIHSSVSKVDELFKNDKKELSRVNGLLSKREYVLLSALKNNFYKGLSTYKKKLYKRMETEGFFEGNPDKVKTKWIGVYIGIVLLVTLVLVFFTIMTYNSGPLLLYPFTVAGGLFFALSMPRRTPKGYSLFRQIKGLKWYLDKGKWRYEHMEKNLFFEEILPLAIALRAVDKLAKEMKDIGIKPPSYYGGSSIDSFSRDFGIFYGASTASFLSSPKSSGWTGKSTWSGGSGFSGGGFSGGGFGGGGGGSW